MFLLIIAIINKRIVQQVSIKYYVWIFSYDQPHQLRSVEITRNVYLNLRSTQA